MAGTFVVDPEHTFASAVLMGVSPKVKFNSGGEQDTSKDGTPKWVAEVAVSWQAHNGIQQKAEVISVTLTTPTDPSQTSGVMPGQPVSFETLLVGVTPVNKRDDGRVTGGAPWYSATALKPASNTNGANGGRSKAAASSGGDA